MGSLGFYQIWGYIILFCNIFYINKPKYIKVNLINLDPYIEVAIKPSVCQHHVTELQFSLLQFLYK